MNLHDIPDLAARWIERLARVRRSQARTDTTGMTRPPRDPDDRAFLEARDGLGPFQEIAQPEMQAGEQRVAFEVIVGRVASRDLAYVWRVVDGERMGTRLALKRALVTNEHGWHVEIAEGMHLEIHVDPVQPTRITSARLI
jgi:hypothetical protein